MSEINCRIWIRIEIRNTAANTGQQNKKVAPFVDSSEKCLLLLFQWSYAGPQRCAASPERQSSAALWKYLFFFQWSCAGPRRCAATPERQSSAARLLIRCTWTHECPRGRRYVKARLIRLFYKVLILIGQICRIRCFNGYSSAADPDSVGSKNSDPGKQKWTLEKQANTSL
jgi:hypothetical protein